MKIGFYTNEQFLNRPDIASSRIRAKWLIKYWPEAEIYRYGAHYDVIVFQKVYIPHFARLFKGVKILDICDPEWMSEKFPIIEMIQECDAVTVSSPELQEQIAKFTTKPVVYVADRMDLEHYKEKKFHSGRAKEAVWFGYSHNIGALKQVARHLVINDLALSTISDKLVTIECIEGELKQRWTKWDLAKFNVDAIKSDFALLPRSIRPADRFKSNNRTVTAWALGLPVVTNGDELKRFIDPEERKKEAALRWAEVQEKYDVRTSVVEMKELIQTLL